MKKRLFTFIITLAFLMSLMQAIPGVSALESSEIEGRFRITAGEYVPSYYNSTSSVFNSSYYNQLNAEQKNAYNAFEILEDVQSEKVTVNISLISSIIFTSASKKPTDAEMEPAWEKIVNIIQPALDAFLMDNALVFWIDLSGGENSSTYGFDNVNGDYKNGSWQWEINELIFNFSAADTYKPNTSSFVSEVETAVNEFETNSDRRYDILKDIHDYLCNNVVYDLNGVYAHEPYGALIVGRAVCEGYAEAFKLLCDRFDIPCVLVFGDGVVGSRSEPHKWNYVQMQDGKWYGVDVTWDDHDKIYYDYFLSGSSTVAKNFGNDTFSQSHIESGYFSTTSPMKLICPVLNSTAYDKDYNPCEHGHTPGEWEIIKEPTYTEQGKRVRRCTVCGEIVESEVIPKLTVPDEDAKLKDESSLSVTGVYLIGLTEKVSVFDLGFEFDGKIKVTDKDDVALENDSIVGTGCKVDVGSVVYIVIVLGDVSGNGKIDSKDYLLIKRAFLGTVELDAAKLRAACIGGTEKPSSKDYLMLKRHFLGTYNIFTK